MDVHWRHRNPQGTCTWRTPTHHFANVQGQVSCLLFHAVIVAVLDGARMQPNTIAVLMPKGRTSLELPSSAILALLYPSPSNLLFVSGVLSKLKGLLPAIIAP